MVAARGRTWLVVALLGMMVLLASSAFAQEGELEVGLDQLHRGMMAQLAGVWAQLVQGVAQDPAFMETAQGEELVARQEALMEVRWMMMEGMAPPEREDSATGVAGTFEFVSWIELDRTYWALDTRTGEMLARECPETPERDEAAGE